MKSILVCLCVLTLPLMACGGSSSTLRPENVIITGLPQYIPPSATPPATDTQAATAILPTRYQPPAGYVTYTPYPGSRYRCQGGVCLYATHTPYPGGVYSTPARIIIPPSLTPRPTYTPYPSATPCSSRYYYFGDEVFTDRAPETLTLGIAIGNVRTHPATHNADRQVSIYQVTIRNLGTLDYILLAPFQIYVAQVEGQTGGWYVSEAAAHDLGHQPSAPMLDALVLPPGAHISFDLYAYTPPGTIEAIAYILDPYANGYDGTIAGGNVAYWHAGTRTTCGRGRISGPFTPPPDTTPAPTRTATATVASCTVTDTCQTLVPGAQVPGRHTDHD